MNKPKIMLMGYGRHGKDTVAEYLKEKYGYTFSSSSWEAAKHIFPVLRHIFGYKNVQECFDDRHSQITNEDSGEVYEMRDVWHDAIKLMVAYSNTGLSRAILEVNDIYVGIRCKDEFQAAKDAGLFDYVVWVDASERHPPEPSSSCTVGPHLADVVLDNNGTLEDLYNSIDKMIIAMEAIHANS
jgi:hypothetical protein